MGGLLQSVEQDRQWLASKEQTDTPLYRIIRAALQHRDLAELRRVQQLVRAWWAVARIQ